MDFNKNNMKKFITLALIISATTFTQAQSNLVFNQALVLNLTTTGTTVPSGKVWKVESADGNYIDVNNSNWNLVMNGSYKNIPVWFPEDTLIKLSTTTSSQGNVRAFRLSVLEFNVVPASTTTGGSGGGVSADGLIFSQVINISFPGSEFTNPLPNSTSIYRIAGQITVPDGKVWKINDVQTYRESGGGNPNTTTLSCNVRLGEYFFNTPTETRKGVYLKSGIHIVTFNISPGFSTSAGSVNKVTINAIEYNE